MSVIYRRRKIEKDFQDLEYRHFLYLAFIEVCISLFHIKGNPGNSGTNWKVVAVVFIVLFCVLVLGVVVVGYKLYVAYCKHNKANHQVGNAHGRGGNCLENGSTDGAGYSQAPRYVESPDNHSTYFDNSDGSKGNSVENGISQLKMSRARAPVTTAVRGRNRVAKKK